MVNTGEKLLELLKDKNLLKESQVKEIIKEAQEKNSSPEEIIQEKELIDSERLTEIKAELVNVPYKSLLDKRANPDYLEIIPVQVAENYHAVCFNKEEKKIYVGITDPYETKTIEAINFLANRENLRPKFFLISEESFYHFYKQYKDLQEEISSALEKKYQSSEGDEEDINLAEGEAEDLKESLTEDPEGAPVAKMVSVIIRHAVEGGASDIHIEPLEKETRVRYRIDGVLKTSLTLPKKIHRSILGRIKVLAKLKIDETRIPQDGRIRLLVNKKRIDFRVSVMPVGSSEKAVMRILDLGKGIPSMEDLGYSGRALRVLKENIKKTYGIFLITGPTGSGKSTTLASVLDILNKEDVNISTLEDPIEYYLKGVNQSQVKPAVGYTFVSGLRSLLRQDPDILMVGEIRDTETVELCIHAGLTGHFVLSTLHTNNAIDVIPRLLDMQVEPYLLGSTLNTIIAQRLVRKICSKCKEKTEYPKDFNEKIFKELKNVPIEILKERIENYQKEEDLKTTSFFKGKGCSHCGGSGYRGRVAIVEIININKSLQRKIMEKNEFLKEEDIKENQNFINMKQDGIIKSFQGFTTIEEVLRVIEN